jgi:hypothetical protein
MNINENPQVMNALQHLAEAGTPARSTALVELICGASRLPAHCP